MVTNSAAPANGAWIDSRGVQRFIILLILLNGAILGLETSPSVMAAIGPELQLADQVILGIFVMEILIRLGGRARVLP